MDLENRYSPKFHIVDLLKLKEDENIAAYFLRVDETVNSILGMGEEIKESIVVQKVLRSLPMRFDPKISALE
jgi:hypothetical protein